MFAKIAYRLTAYLCRTAMECACPGLRALRLKKAEAVKARASTYAISKEQADILNRAIGWRGGR